MADLKISQLTGATTPLAGTEVLPIVQGGATKQVSVANLTAGRTQTSNGIVQGSTATGYNFTANTPAAGMTSQLLNWYEEGTWTPSVGGTATYNGQTGKYTRIGRQVTVTFDLNINVIGTGSTQHISGLPFTPSGNSAGSMGYFAGLSGNYVMVNPLVSGFGYIQFETLTTASSSTADDTAILTSGSRVIATATYFV